MTTPNNQKNIDLIVSVESRKGGVGKTTAALCLARLLKKLGYAVLVLDLDVTGTNAADIASSTFWEDELHVIKKQVYKSPESDTELKLESINLVKLFDGKFMTGKQIPEFTLQNNSNNQMNLDLGKVNVLGSQIYETGNNNKNRGKETTIEHPGVLFDELHSFWLLEFVKQIIHNFSEFARNNISNSPPLKVAIILDNSPGYVGLAPAIHDWLTDLGPILGKFLIVTSLDRQDFYACAEAVELLHNKFLGKWDTSREFQKACRGDDKISIDEDQEKFFLRLVTGSSTTLTTEDSLAFYKTPDKLMLADVNKTNKSESYIDPTKYIAAIINRVPRAVKSGRLKPDLQQENHELYSAIRLLLYEDFTDEINLKRIISYDENIENQFLFPLKINKKGVKRQVNYLIQKLDDSCKKLWAEGEDVTIRKILSDLNSASDKSLRLQLDKSSTILSEVLLTIEKSGFSYITRLIRDEWLPGAITVEFSDILLNYLSEISSPIFEDKINAFKGDLPNSESSEYTVDIRHRLIAEIKENYRHKYSLIINDLPLNLLVNSLVELVSLSIPSILSDSKIRNELEFIFTAVVSIELEHWTKQRDLRNKNFRIQRFLTQEKTTLTEIEENEKIRLSRHLSKHALSRFPDFYKACAYYQARLIDFINDSQFIISLLSYVLENETKDKNFLPFIKNIAEDVIITKSITHKQSPSRMEMAKQSAEYFQEFDEVLNEILNKWEIVNG